ncbi:MAG: DUF3006 domain-containing protein [Lacrimispora sp.]
MQYTVDRIEEGIAVCEDENGEQIKLCASQLPEGVTEGDILSQEPGGWRLDLEETSRRRQKMREKLKRLTE